MNAASTLLSTLLSTGLSTGPAPLSALLALVPADEFVWLLPLCIAIALVSSAAHRENMGQILVHAAKSTIMILGGLLGFMVCVSYVVEWLLA